MSKEQYSPTLVTNTNLIELWKNTNTFYHPQ